MRNLLALSLAALAACSYSEEKAGVTVHVDGVPQTSDHLEVILTDAASKELKRYPVFGAGSAPIVDVVFPEPAQGAFHVAVSALSRDNTPLAEGSADGDFPGQPDLQITLRSTGVVGTFGAPCRSAGAGAQCDTGLECKLYQSTDIGVCTKTCAAAADCSGATPAAVCDAFPGSGGSYCQWDCTAGGQSACPTGLTCRTATGTAKSYCQGT